MRERNSLNKVILIGNVGLKPKIQAHAQSGRSSARFSVATSERVFNPSTRDTTDKTEWHNIVFWDQRLVEFIGKYVDKGKQVIIEGSLRTREYERDGVKQRTTEIVGDKIVLLGRREEGSARTSDTTDLDAVYGRGGSKGAAAAGDDEFPTGDESGGASGGPDDDIPF